MRNNMICVGCILCLAVLVVLCAPTPAEQLSPHFDRETMMPSSQIERGMKGIAKSVFKGVQISEFHVEVLGVLKRSNLGRDMILIRVLDGPVIERESGIMGGMSGSPVYIDGKLIGAIAYTYPFEREPIGGVTSINSMLDAMDTRAQGEASAYETGLSGAYHAVGDEAEVGGHRVSRVAIVPPDEARPLSDSGPTMLMVPVSAPVFCTGLSQAATEYLERFLEPYGLEPTEGPGSLEDPVDVQLEPGAAFGCPMARGDFQISTAGTVTYVNDEVLLGFGHSFMGLGKVEFPLSTAWVHDFIPQYDRSSKSMSLMEEVGVLSQDRNWAVGGRMGPAADRVPATIRVTDHSRDRSRTYHVRVLKHRDLSSSLLVSVVMSAIEATYNSPGEGMIKTSMRLRGERGDEITRQDTYAHSGFPSMTALGDVAEASTLLTNNRFRPQCLQKLEFDAELWDGRQIAAIEDVYAEQEVAKAGEDLVIHVRLRPEDGDIVDKQVKLRMPIALESGQMRLAVGAGADAMALRARVGIAPPTFYSLDEAIEEFEQLQMHNQLFVVAAMPNRGLVVHGSRLSGVPDAVEKMLRGRPRDDITTTRYEVSQTIDVPWVVFGSGRLAIATEDRKGHRGKVRPRLPRPPEREEATIGETAAFEADRAELWWAQSVLSEGTPRLAADDIGTGEYIGHAWPPERPDSALKQEGESEEEQAPPPEPEIEEKKEKEEEEEKEKEEEKKEEEDKKKGAVARKPSVWLHNEAGDYAEAEVDGIAVRSDGRLFVAPPWEKIADFDERYARTLAINDGVAYIGTFDPGNVYRMTADGKELLFETEQFGVCSIHVAEQGRLIVGTMPEGRIFTIDGEGNGEPLCTLDRGSVWAIVSDGEGGYYAGVGPGAAIYHITETGQATRVRDIRQSHVTDLLLDDGELYIATADAGVLYRLDTQGHLQALFEVDDGDITAIAARDDGSVVVGTAPKGQVFAVDSTGKSTKLYEADEGHIVGLASIEGTLYAALSEDGRIVQIIDEDTHALVRQKRNTGVTGLSAGDGKLYAACQTPASLFAADVNGSAKGSLTGTVLDAGRRARWGRVHWQATTPEGARTAIRFRAGNSDDPKDPGWTVWSLPITKPGSTLPGVPPGRFVQYKIEMSKAAEKQTPVLDWLRIRYLPVNRRPQIKSVEPEQVAAVSGEVEMKWKAKDPDDDKVKVTILIREDGQEEFETLEEDITKSEYKWDTKNRDDGVYDVRIVVDDELANAAEAERVEYDLNDITVDNTDPEVGLISGPDKGDDRSFTITGFALDERSVIGNVSWQLGDSETWHAVQLDDGIYDWRYERFRIETGVVDDEVDKLTIRGRDVAGNTTDKVVELPKPEKKKEDEEDEDEKEKKKPEKPKEEKEPEAQKEEKEPEGEAAQQETEQQDKEKQEDGKNSSAPKK